MLIVNVSNKNCASIGGDFMSIGCVAAENDRLARDFSLVTFCRKFVTLEPKMSWEKYPDVRHSMVRLCQTVCGE
jgi:hypothetical protein